MLEGDGARGRIGGPWDATGLEQSGEREPDGSGAIRRLRLERIVSRERVVELDEPRALAYKLLSGLPLRRYAGRVILSVTPTAEPTFTGARPGSGGSPACCSRHD
jgi:hypothetical protein